MNAPDPKPPGLREHKRQQTLQRIVETGMDAFLAKGFEATTLDEIAAAAGISRRTFFRYFASKDEILLGYLRVYADAIRNAVIQNASGGPPLETVRRALLKLIGGFAEERMMATAHLMRQSEALRLRRHAGYLLFEDAICEALCELYPDRDRSGLWLVSMVSISPLRIAVDTWLQEQGKRPLVVLLEEAFERLEVELGDTRRRCDKG
jgi:AcrR family transcriptional regulator